MLHIRKSETLSGLFVCLLLMRHELPDDKIVLKLNIAFFESLTLDTKQKLKMLIENWSFVIRITI